MSITLFRKPRGFLKEDITLFVSAEGSNSPNTSGTLKYPFQSLEYVLDKNNPALFPDRILNSFMRVVLLKPPTGGAKGEKPKWSFNIVLDDAEKQSKRILDCSGNIQQSIGTSPALWLNGVHDIVVLNGMWTSATNPQESLIKVQSFLNIAGMSSTVPQGDAYGIEILESVVKDFPQVDRGISYGNLPIAPVEILSAGDDCMIIGLQFFNNYLCLNLYFSGEGFRVENCVFKNSTKGVISDRRLVTLWNYNGQVALDMNYFAWNVLKGALAFARVISECIFKNVDYPISDYDYFAQLDGTPIIGGISVTGGDLSAVTTSAGSYYPLALNELAGAIIVDSNWNEFKIYANDVFNGVYPFTISVQDETGQGKSPQGNVFYLKQYGQDTYLIANTYANKQYDLDNDGICDYAETYPERGYGLDKCLHPDPMPLMLGRNVIQSVNISMENIKHNYLTGSYDRSKHTLENIGDTVTGNKKLISTVSASILQKLIEMLRYRK